MGQASGRAKGQQASLPPTEDTAASHTKPLEESVVSASLAAHAAEGPSVLWVPCPPPEHSVACRGAQFTSSFLFNFLKKFNWSRVDLQCCASFRYTAM